MEADKTDNPQNPEQKTSWLKLLLALLLGLGLLWFAFKDCDFEMILANLKDLDIFYLVVVFITGLLSHIVRALRWIWLLKPVADRSISLWNSFYATIVGYAVNVVIPRGGEVARLVAISRMEKLPWAAVLPTMFIDRLLDIASLVILIGVSLTILPKQILDEMPWLVPGGATMAFISVVALVLLPRTHSILSWLQKQPLIDKILPQPIKEKLSELSAQFDRGTKSLLDPVAYPVIALFTAAMWLFYGLNFYFMLFAFHIQDKVGVKNCLLTFTIGSSGNLIPTPGTIGTFHVLVKESLVKTAHIDPNLAAAYATVLHLMCFIVVTCVPAAVCVAVNAMLTNKNKNSEETP